MQFQFAHQSLDLSRPQIMGILNVTPDSFSDGGLFNQLDRALLHAEDMLANGASIIDVGGESTRPGAVPVSPDEELDRVIPVIEAIKARFDTIVSVDTSTPEVMLEAAAAGAGLINDVRALKRNGALDAAVKTQLPVCLMHMSGEPDSMQNNPTYQNVTSEVIAFLTQRASEVVTGGVSRHQILLDPGFGFGKTKEHNYRLLNELEKISAIGYPLLTGLSRKRMMASLFNDNVSPEDRDAVSATAAALCAIKGSRIIRTHNVKATQEALLVINAMLEQSD